MGAQSWGQRPLTPGPLLARFVPNCANWSVGSAHWAQHTAQAQIVWDKLLRTVQVRPLRLRPKDQPTIVAQPTAQRVLRTRPPGPHPNWVCIVAMPQLDSATCTVGPA